MFESKNIFLFEGLNEVGTAEILSLLPEKVSFKKGEIIYSTECYERAMGILLSGKAIATKGNIIKRTFSSGDVFGVAAMFGNNDEYISLITAAGACEVQFIPENLLKEIFGKYPQTALNYIAFLSDRVRFLNKKIEQLSGPDTIAKLLSFLKGNADQNGVVEVKNMSALSKMVGIGRTSLYRDLDELEQKGFITRQNNIIRVM